MRVFFIDLFVTIKYRIVYLKKCGLGETLVRVQTCVWNNKIYFLGEL